MPQPTYMYALISFLTVVLPGGPGLAGSLFGFVVPKEDLYG